MNKNEELIPYYEKARSTLIYDSISGLITWGEKTGKRVNIGDTAGCINSRGYRHIRVTIDNHPRELKAHRIAWFIYYGKLPYALDHVDGLKHNNSILNLRECNHSENAMNRGLNKNNKSGFKGVSWNKADKKWVAKISKDGETFTLGMFNSPKKASLSYEKKAKELFGAFYYKK
mgnify:CR=1 FL=1|tara:strand:- start:113 stop:634 length:522 start_codon:yes stop_codon:yes gene_type:complete